MRQERTGEKACIHTAFRASALALAIALPAAGAVAQHLATLDAISARDQVVCGVTTGVAGFSNPDSQGVWRELDADGCRNVAAAIFGNATRVRFIPTTSQNRSPALQSGEVDLRYRNTAWTLGREASLGLQFAGITFYDD